MQHLDTRAVCKRLGPLFHSYCRLALGCSKAFKENADRAEAGNCLVRFCLRLLNTALMASSSTSGRRVRCFWEHPEDLGALLHWGEVLRPASVGQLEDLRLQVGPKTGRTTRAFRQCGFGSPWGKPTRVITDIEGICEWGVGGWPELDEMGWYLGPLPPDCGHSSHVSLAKASPNEAFRTTGTAAYPAAMDRTIAVAVVDSFADNLVKQSEAEAENLAVVRRPVGGVRLPPHL